MTSHTDADEAVQAEDRHGAHNYDPLRVVLCRGEGVWVRDVEGRRYYDALSAYSALNFGHRHPRLAPAAPGPRPGRGVPTRALLTNPRARSTAACHKPQPGPFCAELAEFCETDRVLPMNTGAEAVETAIKLAR